MPSPERERRHALEYEEEEIPPEIAVEVKEAEVSFPNIPVPNGSDGTVSKDVSLSVGQSVIQLNLLELGHPDAKFRQGGL